MFDLVCASLWHSSKGRKHISRRCRKPVLKENNTTRFSDLPGGKLFQFGLARAFFSTREDRKPGWIQHISQIPLRYWSGESRLETLLKSDPRPQLICWPRVNLCMLHSPLMMLYLSSVITIRAFMDDNALHRRGMTTLWQCLFAGRPALECRQRNNNKDPLLSYPSLTSSLIIFPSSVTHPDIHFHLCVNHCRYWRVEGVTPCLWERRNLKSRQWRRWHSSRWVS